MNRTINIKQLAGDALRFLLVFALAFSVTLGAERAAWGAESAGGDVEIYGVSLQYELSPNSNTWSAPSNSFEGIPADHPAITTKGGSLSFRAQVVFADGSTDDTGAAYPVQWSVSDPSLATITNAGVLTAVANGTVQVNATLMATGATASYLVDISGQNNELYVTSVAVVDDNLAPYDSGTPLSLTSLEDTVALNARVTVADPATGSTTDYYTANGALSSQTSGALSDIAWYVSNSSLGYVDPSTGVFRPSAEATVTVTAASPNGEGGATVEGSVFIQTKVPASNGGEEQPNDGNAQSTLTVEVVNVNANDEVVTSKTYTPEDLESLFGIEQHAYTLVGSDGGFSTVSAEGVSLARIIDDMGVDDVAAIKQFTFGTADVYSQALSYEALFAPRYFFPNYDNNGSTQDGENVPPMIALRTAEKSPQFQEDTSTPDYSNLSDGERFRLVLGATADRARNGLYMVKWINTLRIEVTAAVSPLPPNDNEGPTGDNPGEPGGGNGTGDGTGDGNGSGTGTGNGTGDGSDGASGISLSGEAGGGSGSGSGDGIGDGSGSGSGSGAGGWSVYQIMNPHRANIPNPDFENPWSPYLPPMTVGVGAAGAVQVAVSYRRQRLPLR